MMMMIITVERVEPVIAASIQLTVEFALCYLEKSICNSDDSVLQVLEFSFFFFFFECLVGSCLCTMFVVIFTVVVSCYSISVTIVMIQCFRY